MANNQLMIISGAKVHFTILFELGAKRCVRTLLNTQLPKLLLVYTSDPELKKLTFCVNVRAKIVSELALRALFL